MEPCSCTYNYYCAKARALRTKENMAYERFISSKFSHEVLVEYNLAASMRREHRKQALEVFNERD